MRSAPLLLLLCCALPPTLVAQAPQAGAVHCTIQPAAPLTDADRAFIAGDFAKAESLYSAQLSGPAAAANYLGTVRAQLAQNKLAEALATAQHATNITPSAAQALLGDVLLRSGKVEDAGTAFNKAVATDPCWARGQFGLGRLSDLTSHHATAARKLAAAHTLAPGDAEITAAGLAIQPAAQRAAGLHTLLASNPVLAPEIVERLTGELAILDQHKTCTAEPFTTANLTLDPIMINGIYERSWGLKTRINDADTPLLELDSAVSGIVLSQKDAQRAGVKPLTTVPTSPNAAYLAYADRVKIGNLEYHDCPVHVVPAAALGNGNSLIGTDFFRDHLIHIDYVAKLLALNSFPGPPGLAQPGTTVLTDPYTSPEEKNWSPVYILGANLIMPTMINKQGPFSFLIDTGTGRTIISPAVQSAVLGSGKDATLNLIGTSGPYVKVMRREGGGDILVTSVRGPDGNLLRVTTPIKLPVYRFTKNEFTDDLAVSFDISTKSHDMGYEVSALLGFYVLSNYFIDINYRDGLVQILWDPNQRYKVRQIEKESY
jgi:tetratricopeptide (TPR) repeat protein